MDDPLTPDPERSKPVPDAEDETPARPQHSRELAQRNLEIVHVAEHSGRDDSVESVVAEGQPLDAGLEQPVGCLRHAGAGKGDHVRRAVDAPDRPATLVQLCREATRPHARIEHLARPASEQLEGQREARAKPLPAQIGALVDRVELVGRRVEGPNRVSLAHGPHRSAGVDTVTCMEADR